MNATIKNILAVIAGVILGNVVNMALIMVSSSIIPLPAGVDPTNMESIKSSMHLFETKHFIFPFLAHALGTFSGALLTARIVSNRKMQFALGIGVLFFILGVINTFMLPAPTWFVILDLAGAYLPMSLFAWKLIGDGEVKE